MMLTGLRSWKKMDELKYIRQILGERNREEKHLDSPWSQELRNVRYCNCCREGASSSGRAVPTASKKKEKPSLPAGKPAPPAQNRNISVLTISLILASVRDLAGPAPNDTLHPLRTTNDAKWKFHHDYSY